MTAAAVAAVLRRYRFRYQTEDDLQAAILVALERNGIEARREVRLGSRHRVDLLAGGVVVEVKVQGSDADVRRQLLRYAAEDACDGIVLVTNRVGHRPPETLVGKPVEVVYAIALA